MKAETILQAVKLMNERSQLLEMMGDVGTNLNPIQVISNNNRYLVPNTLILFGAGERIKGIDKTLGEMGITDIDKAGGADDTA